MSQKVIVFGWNEKPQQLFFPVHWSATTLPLLVYLTAEEAIIQCGYEIVCRSRFEDSLIRRCIDRALAFRTGINVNVLAAGRHMLVFATQDAVVWTVGLNNIRPKAKGESQEPQESIITSIASGTHVSKIDVGDYHCLLVATLTGQLFAFGRGTFGELGNGERYEWVEDPTPVLMPPGELVVSISAGSHYSAVVGSSGSIYTFGSGSYYRLGIGTDEDCIIPTRIFSLDGLGGPYEFNQSPTMSQCCCGSWHTVAVVRDTQDVYAWGWNKFGQAGGTSEEIIPQPRRITVLDDLLQGEELQSVTCGSRHTALLTTTGRVIVLGRLGRTLPSAHSESDTSEDFAGAEARELFVDGQSRVIGISSSMWSLSVVTQQGSAGFFPQPNQFS